MKIGKYISELLFENDFVILPQLGEFSTKYIPAKFIPELKKVESPSKTIVFNDKNKSGGGLLTEYIAKKENMSSQEAREFVNNFVSEMLNSLRSGKKVELESIGVFSMEQSGTILFEGDKSINYLNDSMGMSSVKEPAKKSEADAKSELDKVLEDVSPEIAPKVEKPTTPVPPPPTEELKPVAAVPPEAEPTTNDVKPSGNISQRPPVTPLRPVQEPVSQKIITPSRKTEPADQQPVKPGLPPAVKWTALTVVPLLIIIIILALNFEYLFGDKSVIWNKKETTTPVTTETTTTTTPQEQADVDETESVTEESPSFDPTVVPAGPESGRKVYYIVVGSFEEEHSAMILAEELRSKGAQTANVFPVNRLGFYRVYYGYYYDLNQAENQLIEAQKVNPQAWILHR
jgi:hypothetical protein